MSFLLKFIGIVFLIMFVAVVWIAYTFYKKVKPTINQFKNQRKEEGVNYKGNIIIDKRTDAQRNKKVFKDNEGEYIDYKESDNA